MQKLLIFLSISLIYLWIHNSNANPMNSFASESNDEFDESDSIRSKSYDDSAERSSEIHSLPIQVKESDQSSEEKQKVREAFHLINDLTYSERRNIVDDSRDNDDDDNDEIRY